MVIMGRQTKKKLEEKIVENQIWMDSIKKGKKGFVKEKRGKGKDPEQVLNTILPLKTLKDKYIRPLEDWKPNCYNPIKQKYNLIDWLLVDYRVPLFMYDIFFKRDRMDEGNYLKYKDWFIIIAQGGSFYKATKDIFSKKEAFHFLHAPDGNSIGQNIWYARFKAAGIDEKYIRVLLRKNFPSYGQNDPTWIRFIEFFAKQQDYATEQDLQEMLDYIHSLWRDTPDFKFSGRTWASMVRLSNTWHAQFRNLPKEFKGRDIVYWEGMDIRDWEQQLRFGKEDPQYWHIIQLKNSKALWSEGSTQGHCVGGYVGSCVSGHSAIFTMEIRPNSKKPWKKLVTIEVNSSRTVTQVRGKFNRMATPREKGVLRMWASSNGLTIRS